MRIPAPASRRLAILASALACASVSLGIVATAAPAQAASGGYYTATLTNPTNAKREVLGGVAWNCQGNTCVAGKGDARPLRICRGLARKFGEVASFKTNGEDMTAEELAKCNGQ